MANSPEYDKALQASREASKEYAFYLAAYRNQQIGDAEYLAARQKYMDAEVIFDAAYQMAHNCVE